MQVFRRLQPGVEIHRDIGGLGTHRADMPGLVRDAARPALAAAKGSGELPGQRLVIWGGGDQIGAAQRARTRILRAKMAIAPFSNTIAASCPVSQASHNTD